ncbi:hypothetical protein L0991_03525 [Vibrio chagasii]|uniref:hypothetical protein n=1 Tax=Vibrio chagasii TaxID=170679 RepID=UPI0035A72D20
MKKYILTISSILFASMSIAKEVDLSKYNEDCKTRYENLVNRKGKSDFNGVFLEYKDEDKIMTNLKRVYFNPDADVSIRIGNSFKDLTIYDLTVSDYSYTFYDKSARNGKRRGHKWVFERKNFDTYELKIFEKSSYSRNKDRTYTTHFEKPLNLSSDANIEKFVLVYERGFDQEELLKSRYTILKDCLKR